MANKLPKLTKKQMGFVKDYIATGNGTQSALKNYDVNNANTARSIASENLTKPAIRANIRPIVERYKKELDAIISAMELKDKNTEEYQTLVNAAEKIHKLIELLSGNPTERILIDQQDVQSKLKNLQQTDGGVSIAG